MPRLFIIISLNLIILACSNTKLIIPSAPTTTPPSERYYHRIVQKFPSFNELQPADCRWKYDIASELSDKEENPILFEVLKVYKGKDINELPLTILLVRPYIKEQGVVTYFGRNESLIKEPFKPYRKIESEIAKVPDVERVEPTFRFHIYLYGMEISVSKPIGIYAKGVSRPKKIGGRERWIGNFSDIDYQFKLPDGMFNIKKYEKKWVVDELETRPSYCAIAIAPNGTKQTKRKESRKNKIKMTYDTGISAIMGAYDQSNLRKAIKSSRIFFRPGDNRNSYYIEINDNELIGKKIVVGMFLQDKKGEHYFLVNLVPGSTINLKGKEYKIKNTHQSISDSGPAFATKPGTDFVNLTVYLKDERVRPVIDKKVYVAYKNGDRFFFGVTDADGKIVRAVDGKRLFRLYAPDDSRYKYIKTKDISLESERTIHMVLPRQNNKVWLRIIDNETGADVGNASVKVTRGSKFTFDLYVTPKYGSKYYYCRKFPIYPDESFDISVMAPGRKSHYMKNVRFDCDSINEKELTGCTGLARTNPIIVFLESESERGDTIRKSNKIGLKQNELFELTVHVRDKRNRSVPGMKVFLSKKGKKYLIGTTDSSGVITTHVDTGDNFYLFTRFNGKYGIVQTEKMVLYEDRTITLNLPRPEKMVWFRIQKKEADADIGNARILVSPGGRKPNELYVTPRYGKHFYYTGKVPLYIDEPFNVSVKAPGRRDFSKNKITFNCEPGIERWEPYADNCRGLDKDRPIIIKLHPLHSNIKAIIRPYFRAEGERKGVRDLLILDSTVNVQVECTKFGVSGLRLGYDKEKNGYPFNISCPDGGNIRYIISSNKFEKVQGEIRKQQESVRPEMRFIKPILSVLIQPNSRFLLGAQYDDDGPYESFSWIKKKYYDLSVRLDSKSPWAKLWSRTYFFRWWADEHTPMLIEKRVRFRPRWYEEVHRKNFLEKIYPQKETISYSRMIDQAIGYLNGFSLPIDRNKGVILIIMGAPAQLPSVDELLELDKKLHRNHLIALIAQFNPTGADPRIHTAFPGKSANLKIISYGRKKEEQTYFGSSLGAHILIELKEMMNENGIIFDE